MERKLNLKNNVLVGRNFEEYYKMFDLKSLDLDREFILDVASGVSSFCAEASNKGYRVVASDRIYGFTSENLENKCKRDLDFVIEQLSNVIDLYKWEVFKDVNELEKNRKKAYQLFLEDFKKYGKERYINVEYPISPFNGKQFTTTLVSHFLFLYDEHLNYEFHKKIISELIRVTSNEIRIFPLVNLKGKKSLHLEQFLKDFSKYDMEIRKVDYEFVINGNEMLVIKCK